jgi:hypothetical protein
MDFTRFLEKWVEESLEEDPPAAHGGERPHEE